MTIAQVRWEKFQGFFCMPYDRLINFLIKSLKNKCVKNKSRDVSCLEELKSAAKPGFITIVIIT